MLTAEQRIEFDELRKLFDEQRFSSAILAVQEITDGQEPPIVVTLVSDPTEDDNGIIETFRMAGLSIGIERCGLGTFTKPRAAGEKSRGFFSGSLIRPVRPE